MSEQVLIQFRADKVLKQEVSAIYEQLGMDLPTAFRMFMLRSKQVRGLPFAANLPAANLPEAISHEEALQAFHAARAQLSAEPEMTLEEINREILEAENAVINGTSAT